mgnify:CR=1 FL=1
MIQEDYVSFEVAKLLKDKGFNEATNRYYNAQYDGIRTVSDTFMTYWNNENHMKGLMMEGAIAIPTLQMAMKWLREVHNIHIVIKIVIRTYGDTEYYYELYGTKNKSLCVVCDIYNGESWGSSEEACEAALKYVLENLI